MHPLTGFGECFRILDRVVMPRPNANFLKAESVLEQEPDFLPLTLVRRSWRFEMAAKVIGDSTAMRTGQLRWARLNIAVSLERLVTIQASERHVVGRRHGKLFDGRSSRPSLPT